MQMVWPCPTLGSNAPRRACSMTQRNARSRLALKLTNGPAAVAEASHSLGTNSAAIFAATAGGARPMALAAGKHATAKSPKARLGGASTLKTSAARPERAATSSRAA